MMLLLAIFSLISVLSTASMYFGWLTYRDKLNHRIEMAAHNSKEAERQHNRFLELLEFELKQQSPPEVRIAEASAVIAKSNAETKYYSGIRN